MSAELGMIAARKMHSCKLSCDGFLIEHVNNLRASTHTYCSGPIYVVYAAWRSLLHVQQKTNRNLICRSAFSWRLSFPIRAHLNTSLDKEGEIKPYMADFFKNNRNPDGQKKD